jgi:hypothetical protein
MQKTFPIKRFYRKDDAHAGTWSDDVSITVAEV